MVTPANKDKIIIFVTREKQASYEQYKNNLVGDLLEWEGPTDHFAEGRMLSAHQTGDEIHVFYRARHHSDFEYKGVANVEEHELRQDAPSSFKLSLLS